MPPEAAMTKTMRILGQTQDPEKIRSLFYPKINKDVLWKA